MDHSGTVMIMSMSRASLAVALTVLTASMASPHAPQTRQAAADPADCSEPAWGDKVTRFDAQVRAYAELRDQSQRGLVLKVAETPAGTPRADLALAKRIRAARATARQGDIFTPALSIEFKKALRREMNAHVWKVIMDDNPGEFLAQVNGAYPDGKPLATMPPNILAVLPRLPADIEYRFVERHLILLDTRANLIVDRIPYAIHYSERETTCR
jgi:hypothetical protein